MIYSYAAPMPMKLRPPLQNSEKLLIFGANLDEFLLTAKQIFINDASGKLFPTHLTSPSLFSSILLKSSLALPRLELSVPIISYTADTTLNNIGME